MYKVIKRCFDVISASLLFIVISPVFFIIALLVLKNHGKPIFFHQIRSGKDMKPFGMIKFRTMTNEKDEKGNLLPDEQRATKFGKWLRSTSLDELPELLNIIKGEMSVIGPRPLYPRYNDYFTEEEKKRFQVRGGLITPDSVDPEPVISWDKEFQYDADYAANVSLTKDISIFIGVFRILFKRNTTNYGAFVREPLDVERANMKQK
jgi:lipopolysaccharide/colanic/teichoic acid biosynthesis glycosyltransferase